MRPSGENVAQAVTIPLQLGSVPNAMRTLLARHEESSPRATSTSSTTRSTARATPDIFVVKPSFADDRLLGFAVTVAHHGDVGGRVPGTIACDSTEVFQEGLRLPWLKLVDRGEPVEALYEILRANVRIPHELLWDLACAGRGMPRSATAWVAGARRAASPSLHEPGSTALLDHNGAATPRRDRPWLDGSRESSSGHRLGRYRCLRQGSPSGFGSTVDDG